jgi:hypothetical protein
MQMECFTRKYSKKQRQILNSNKSKARDILNNAQSLHLEI